VTHNTDDPSLDAALEDHLLADRILVRPVSVGQGLVDENQALCTRGILLAEDASPLQGNA